MLTAACSQRVRDVNCEWLNGRNMDTFYAVVEFEDGLQIVPHNWLSIDKKKSWWPHYTNINTCNKAAKNKENIQDTWQEHDVIKIWATTRTYEKANEKLIQAQTYSDISSGSDYVQMLKKSRKERAKILLSDVESDDLEIDIPNYPVPPKTPKLTQALIDEEKEKKQKSLAQRKGIETKLIEETSNRSNKEMSFQQFVIRKLTDIDIRLKAIEELQHELNKKMNAFTTTAVETNTQDAQISLDLPINNEKNLEELEDYIRNSSYRQILIRQLNRIGGESINNTVYKILRYLFTNDMAMEYSWGGKHKKAFCNLGISKIIFDVMWNKYPHITETDIINPVKSWLAHAKERFNAECMRMSNYNTLE